jgi:hypothetical protein
MGLTPVTDPKTDAVLYKNKPVADANDFITGSEGGNGQKEISPENMAKLEEARARNGRIEFNRKAGEAVEGASKAVGGFVTDTVLSLQDVLNGSPKAMDRALDPARERLIEQAQKEGAEIDRKTYAEDGQAAAYLGNAAEQNTFLKEGDPEAEKEEDREMELPASVSETSAAPRTETPAAGSGSVAGAAQGAAGGSPGTAPETPAQSAAVRAGQALYQLNQQKAVLAGASGQRLANMESDLNAQGTRLAASIVNMPPEKQRAELLKWQGKIERDQAYSPRADNISPQEAEARRRVVNGVMRSVTGKMQSNSLERQRSQELADMQTRMDEVIAGVSAGVYNDNPQGAYEDGLNTIGGAARHLSPQQYRSAVTGLYDGITSEIYGAVMGDILKKYAGEPIDETGELDGVLDSMEEVAQAGAGFLSGGLGTEGLNILTVKAAGFAANARKQVADYNTGLLDSWNREYNMAVEKGDYPKIAEIANRWKPYREQMINAGTITGEQEYKTRNYFGVAGKTGEGNGGAASAAKKVITGLQEFMVTGGATDMSPAKALEITAKDIQRAQTNEDGSRLTDWQARDLAVFHLADQWLKSNDFKDGDAVKQAYLNLSQNLEGWVKDKGLDGDTAMKLTNDAYHVFWNGLFNMNPNSTPHQIEEKAADIATNFYDAAKPVFDSNNSIDEDMEAGRNDVNELRTAVGKIRNMAGQMGMPPESLAKTQLMAGTYEGVVTAIRSHAADLIKDIGDGRFIDVEPDALQDLITVRADEDTGGFRVSVDAGDRKSGGTISRSFDVKFDQRGRLVFADKTGEYTLTGDGAYGKWRRPFEDAAVQRERKEDEANENRFWSYGYNEMRGYR